MQFESHGISDIGRTRRRNEDSFLVDRDHAAFAVADGLGGLPDGALASSKAITMLGEALMDNDGPDDLNALFQRINSEIQRLGQQLSPETGIGTTLTVGMIEGDRLRIAHVGDTAIYRFRKDDWEQLTMDHTLEQEIRNRPDFNPRIPIPRRHSHVLTRCLGQIEDLMVDTHSAPLSPGDRLLFCSDGVTLSITHDEIHECIQQADTPEAAVSELIALANERGGRDNATAIAVFLK
jgi:PPM family protein phosphatase